MTEQTRQSVDDYIRAAGKKPGEFLFIGRHGPEQCMTTRQYARLVSGWVGSIGLDPKLFGNALITPNEGHSDLSTNRESESGAVATRAYED